MLTDQLRDPGRRDRADVALEDDGGRRTTEAEVKGKGRRSEGQR